MELLNEIFEKQRILQERLGYDFETMTEQERAAYVKEYAQHTDHEMHEMLAEIPFFKSWKKYSDKPELNEACWETAREEFIDALHFFMNCALALGFDANLLYYMFVDKNDVNHGRQEDHVNYKPCIDTIDLSGINNNSDSPKAISSKTISINNIAMTTGRSIEEVANAVSEQMQKVNARGR